MFSYDVTPIKDYDGSTMYKVTIFSLEEELNNLGNVTQVWRTPVRNIGCSGVFTTLGDADRFGREWA